MKSKEYDREKLLKMFSDLKIKSEPHTYGIAVTGITYKGYEKDEDRIFSQSIITLSKDSEHLAETFEYEVLKIIHSLLRGALKD